MLPFLLEDPGMKRREAFQTTNEGVLGWMANQIGRPRWYHLILCLICRTGWHERC